MEIDITAFVTQGEAWDFSGSVATHGPNAARDTWNNAMREASESPLLVTEEQIQALRDHVEGMGFGEEVQDYGADQCNALFLQIISGDLQELEDLCMGDDGEIDWEEAERLAQAGTLGGSMHESGGRYFYYLGE